MCCDASHLGRAYARAERLLSAAEMISVDGESIAGGDVCVKGWGVAESHRVKGMGAMCRVKLGIPIMPAI
jgi:hypothetical protein